MTERYIELGKQAGWAYEDGDNWLDPLWKFADLVRADEREACAVVAEKYEYSGGWLAAAKNIAATIRARGNT